MYGLELVRTLAEVDGMVLSEGTLYPLLSRLRKEELVDTTWQESAAGPPGVTTASPPRAGVPWPNS